MQIFCLELGTGVTTGLMWVLEITVAFYAKSFTYGRQRQRRRRVQIPKSACKCKQHDAHRTTTLRSSNLTYSC